MELAYGGLSILKKHAQDIPSATLGLVAITLAMIALATFAKSHQRTSCQEWLRGVRQPAWPKHRRERAGASSYSNRT